MHKSRGFSPSLRLHAIHSDADINQILRDMSDRLLDALRATDGVRALARRVGHVAGLVLRDAYMSQWIISDDSRDPLADLAVIDRFRDEAALSARAADLVAVGVSEAEAVDRWLAASLASGILLLEGLESGDRSPSSPKRVASETATTRRTPRRANAMLLAVCGSRADGETCAESQSQTRELYGWRAQDDTSVLINAGAFTDVQRLPPRTAPKQAA